MGKLISRMVRTIGRILKGLRKLRSRYPDDADAADVLRDAQILSDDVYYLKEKSDNKQGR